MIKEAITRVNGGTLEGAPDWYDTPLDQLDFQWTPEEKIEIERYCEKIHKNIAQDEMTPYQRLQALVKGEPKDRQFVHYLAATIHVARVYDGFGDIVKPIDLEHNPKLWVKAHLYAIARLNSDDLFLHPMSYTEEIWGGKVKSIDYGQPCLLAPPIKTMADLEKTQVPDPTRDGVFPGFLWSVREMRRIFNEYGLTGVMPILGGLGPGLDCVVGLGMTGIGQFMTLLHKDVELCKRATAMAGEWNKRLDKEVHDLLQPDWWQQCTFTGSYPMKGKEWLQDAYLDLAKYLKGLAPDRHLHFGLSSFDRYTEWLDVLQENGAVGPDAFDGGFTGCEPWEKFKKMIDYHREHNLYLTGCIPDEIMQKGPVSAIEEQMKELCEYSKSSPKFAIAVLSDFWTLQGHWEAGIAAAKKYGRY